MLCSKCGGCPVCDDEIVVVVQPTVVKTSSSDGDLTSKLRKAAEDLRTRHVYMDGHAQLMEEAATEIEKLRREKP